MWKTGSWANEMFSRDLCKVVIRERKEAKCRIEFVEHRCCASRTSKPVFNHGHRISTSSFLPQPPRISMALPLSLPQTPSLTLLHLLTGPTPRPVHSAKQSPPFTPPSSQRSISPCGLASFSRAKPTGSAIIDKLEMLKR